MLETWRSKSLEDFTNELCAASVLYKVPFNDLYPWHFDYYSNALQKEIISNLTSLSDKKFNTYINFVANEIKKTYVYDPNDQIIGMWIEKYNLNVSDFPFSNNDRISTIISSVLKPSFPKNIENQLDRRLIFDFHSFAVFLEYNKIITFINSLLPEEDNGNLATKNSMLPLNPYPRIFTSFEAYVKFKNLVDEFGNTKHNLSNYSFVYHRMVKDKLIYEDYKQTEFVFFLLEFNVNISRIKPKTQFGNKDIRESIYNSIK
jgi:hypothetical protein